MVLFRLKVPQFLGRFDVEMSPIGTFETCQPAVTMSVSGGKTGSSLPTVKPTRLTGVRRDGCSDLSRIFAALSACLGLLTCVRNCLRRGGDVYFA